MNQVNLVRRFVRCADILTQVGRMPLPPFPEGTLKYAAMARKQVNQALAEIPPNIMTVLIK
jgi:hypothetical protein